jgi:hypothetical protein
MKSALILWIRCFVVSFLWYLVLFAALMMLGAFLAWTLDSFQPPAPPCVCSPDAFCDCPPERTWLFMAYLVVTGPLLNGAFVLLIMLCSVLASPLPFFIRSLEKLTAVALSARLASFGVFLLFVRYVGNTFLDSFFKG